MRLSRGCVTQSFPSSKTSVQKQKSKFMIFLCINHHPQPRYLAFYSGQTHLLICVSTGHAKRLVSSRTASFWSHAMSSSKTSAQRTPRAKKDIITMMRRRRLSAEGVKRVDVTKALGQEICTMQCGSVMRRVADCGTVKHMRHQSLIYFLLIRLLAPHSTRNLHIRSNKIL